MSLFHFTLIDFRGATHHFADPDFDGQPVQIYSPGPNDPICPPDPERRKKVYVDGVSATIIAERVEYLDENGKLVTESLRDFTKKALRKRFAVSS